MIFFINLLILVNDSISKVQNFAHQKDIPNIQEKPISLYVQLILGVTLLIVIVGLVLYLGDQLLKHWSFFKKVRESMKDNYFLILIFFPLFYLVYFYAYYLPCKGNANSFIWVRPETAEFLLTASLTFLATGTLTGALKWLNNLAFFKKQFSELIKSDDFSNVLSEKMKELALSDDYLLQRNDLEEIWTRVTLCKYQQKFPELAPEIQKKIENDLFLEKSLSYYYKNFRLQINLSLEGDIIKTTEISSFTVISHTTDKIEINFGMSSPVVDGGEIYTKLIHEECKCDGKVLDLKTENGEDEDGNLDLKNTLFKAYLEGKKKYIIERQIEMTQNIKDDRVFSFSSSRIIEDLSINLKLDKKLDHFFSPVGKNVFYIDNQLRGEQSKSYINRDLLLPGEKFKVFIYKIGQKNL
jgi:hypothetical protein